VTPPYLHKDTFVAVNVEKGKYDNLTLLFLVLEYEFFVVSFRHAVVLISVVSNHNPALLHDAVDQIYLITISSHYHSQLVTCPSENTIALRDRKLRQGQNVILDSNPDFRIRMSAGSVPKCCGCIFLSARVISPSIV